MVRIISGCSLSFQLLTPAGQEIHFVAVARPSKARFHPEASLPESSA
jgi:hypothetical protein